MSVSCFKVLSLHKCTSQQVYFIYSIKLQKNDDKGPALISNGLTESRWPEEGSFQVSCPPAALRRGQGPAAHRQVQVCCLSKQMNVP